MTKRELRKYYLDKRNTITEEDRINKSIAIISNLKRELLLEKLDVLTYVSYKSEVDTIEFIKEELKINKRNILAPKVIDKDMLFYRIDDYSDLKSGYKGILEPDNCVINDRSGSFDENGIILVPGACFDLNGNRIGYGGGYYDRFLAKHKDLVKIGLLFEEQLYDGIISSEAFDIKLDYLITDKRIIKI